jgi:hypothetical protein
MRPPINEFARDISAYKRKQGVIAHSQTIFDAVSAWIPSVNGGHGARIGRDDRRERQTAMTVLASASGYRRNHDVTQAAK